MPPPEPSENHPRRWRLAIDTGGTFTDCLAVSPDGRSVRVKVPSDGQLRGRLSRPSGGWRLEVHPSLPAGFLDGARLRAGPESARLLGLGADEAAELDEVPEAWMQGEPRVVSIDLGCSAPRLAMAIAMERRPDERFGACEVRLATTRGTNALLERRVEQVGLITNRGFEDVLEIGDQTRPDLFALAVAPRRSLAAHSAGICGRLAADGSTVEPLDEDSVRGAAAALRDAGAEAIAISLVNAYADPAMEGRIAELLASEDSPNVCIASELSRRPGFLERTATATANAAIGKVIREFLAGVRRPGESISVAAMTSDGRLVDGGAFQPVESLLSGPAGGAMGVLEIARRLELGEVIGFDMGGTSTDVVRVEGELPVAGRTRVGDALLALPSVAIETVAAGGGSICSVGPEGLLEVGPQSAGADPGPACYGRGGPLTITDVNVLLGRVDREQFGVPLFEDAAAAAFEQVRERARSLGTIVDPPEAMLEAWLAIANERMAGAIEAVSSRQGFAPREHALVAFGGAGGQHACSIADRLGIERIAFPAEAGLLSALGVQSSARAVRRERSPNLRLEGGTGPLSAIAREVIEEARAALLETGVAPAEVDESSLLVEVHLRLAGQDDSIECRWDPQQSIAAVESTLSSAFQASFRAQYGYPPPDRPIEVALVAAVVRERRAPPTPLAQSPPRPAPAACRFTRLLHDGDWCDVGIHARESLAAGTRLEGPVLIADRTATLVLETGWRGEVLADGSLLAVRRAAAAATAPTSGAREVFAARLAAIAEEMGERLRRTALSVNIKHRLDYSCAILDGEGRLVANAAHLPVHLGALGIAARAVLASTQLAPGDVIVTNHPAFGGSHLPDVTVLTPVFASGESAPIAILANRAHHAEIGGVRPGSMAPSARTLAEEGVVIPPTHLFERGDARWDRLRTLLQCARHPSRAVEENLADLAAQVAANHRGAEKLQAMLERSGPSALRGELLDLARHGLATLRAALPQLLPARRAARVELDDGTPIAVALHLETGPEGLRIVVDFTGSGPVHASNLNAPRAIVHAAVLYVLRVLVGPSVPLHEGLMEAVDLRVPRGLLDPPCSGDPARDPAVAAGNTETSQRIVECLLLAFGAVAGGQGTMNNTLFGDASFGYYETICGGAGAGPGFDGASAVHTHMTNTRIGDPEFIERRYPLRIESFSIRRGSGGEGEHLGGSGVRRVYRALAPVSVCVVAQHRHRGGPGLAGGEDGLPGSQLVLRANGRTAALAASDEVDLEPDDRLEILTPGGGGFGERAQ